MRGTMSALPTRRRCHRRQSTSARRKEATAKDGSDTKKGYGRPRESPKLIKHSANSCCASLNQSSSIFAEVRACLNSLVFILPAGRVVWHFISLISCRNPNVCVRTHVTGLASVRPDLFQSLVEPSCLGSPCRGWGNSNISYLQYCIQRGISTS